MHGSIMLWKCFSTTKTGNLDVTKYSAILEENVLEAAKDELIKFIKFDDEMCWQLILSSVCHVGC